MNNCIITVFTLMFAKLLLKSVFGLFIYSLLILAIIFKFPFPGSLQSFSKAHDLLVIRISSKIEPTTSNLAKVFNNGSGLFANLNPSRSGTAVFATSTYSSQIVSEDIESKNKPLDSGVSSIINLRYNDKTYLIESTQVDFILNNSSQLVDAKIYFNEAGDEKIRKIVETTLLAESTNEKYTQKNSNGILREEIPSFEVYRYDYGPDVEDAISEVKRVISTRLAVNQGNQEYITVRKIEHFGTNGEYSKSKYIELDDTNQMIYAWDNGKLYKAWQASGFYDEYAVYGVFDIKNKAKTAWSPIAEKWMPYWMAFYYAKDQAAWFGLHELVWWYDEDGDYHEESDDSVGQKKSGGCVRLDRGEMVELYNFTEVGIHFLIY